MKTPANIPDETTQAADESGAQVPSAEWFLERLHEATEAEKSRMADIVSACALIRTHATFSGSVERGFLAGIHFARNEVHAGLVADLARANADKAKLRTALDGVMLHVADYRDGFPADDSTHRRITIAINTGREALAATR